MPLLRKKLNNLLKTIRIWVGPLALGRIPGLRNLYFWLISNPAFVNGHYIFLHSRNKDLFLSRKLIDDKLHEELELKFFKDLVKPGMAVLDIGANIGYYTLLAAKLVGKNGRIFAFEPDSTNFSLLTKSIRKNRFKNIVLTNKAVSNKTGRGYLYLCEDNLGDHRTFDSGDLRQKIDIEFITIDDFMEKNQFDFKVDLIKMDIQGFELYALEGMNKIINYNTNLILLIEYWPNGLSMARANPKKLYDYLTSFKFKVYNIDEKERGIIPISFQGLSNKLTGDKFSNLLCIKNSTMDIDIIQKEDAGPA